MKRLYWGSAVTAIAFFLAAGCNSEPASPRANVGPPPADGHAGHDHAHPHEGPHKGHLIELGKEEYHAELVHDDANGTVTIYILDGAAKAAVPIEATEVTVNLKHDGKPEQFKLAASPQEGDGEGKSSRFVSNDKELAEDLDHKGAEPRLVLTINGKSFTGDMAHDHDGHDHK